MSDNYQAVYDAVRSRLGNCDVGEAIRQALAVEAQGLSYAIERVKSDFLQAAEDARLPSVLYRPELKIDGNVWCALYGDNLQDGVAGFGASPVAAMADFDKNWNAKLPKSGEIGVV